MASIGQDQISDDPVALILGAVSNGSELNGKLDDSDVVAVSTAEITSWNLPSLVAHKVLKVGVHPIRLIEESSYFRGLLSGSYSEARHSSISIHWDAESFLIVLRFIFGCPVEITSDNFVPLNEAALFFGVDSLLSKCHLWFDQVTSSRVGQSPQLSLDDLIHIWIYGVEHANDYILQRCTSYLATNFMWASSLNFVNDVPETLLSACIHHPDLTVDSEKHLCNAILLWLNANSSKLGDLSSNNLFHKVHTSLLPLWFVAGKKLCPLFSTYGDKTTGSILSLVRHPAASLTSILREDGLSHLRIRLTKYTQKVDVSSCPQITEGLFFISLLSLRDAELILKKIIKEYSIKHVNSGGDQFVISHAMGNVLTFEAVQELDISNCPALSLQSAVDFLCKSFSSLRTLRAAYFLNFKTANLCQLVRKFPLLTSIDLSLDVCPVIPARVSIISYSEVLSQQKSMASFDNYYYHSTVLLPSTSMPSRSNITKLILVGRIDIKDSDILIISDVCLSLVYFDMTGCMSVTDNGISVFIKKCKMLQSILACDTSFGNKSILALCSSISSETQQAQSGEYQLQTLHVGGCHGANGKTLSELMSESDNLKSLCLGEIEDIDDALYRFSGTSLEILDVSDTKVSCAALSHVVLKNPGLKSLKTRGCRHLVQQEIGTNGKELCSSSNVPEEWYSELGKSCKLEEIELGWGASFSSLGALKPALRALRTLVVGLGGSLGDDGLKLLPSICQELRSLILYFQVISDSAITGIITMLPHLQFLALCYCFGDISSLSFKFRMPNLRILKLERVTPWMTNGDLASLAENCVNLVELSLIGCTLLDSEAQVIISSGWPGLTSLCLEECGEITAGGVVSLLECHALEDLTLRHTGSGIPRNFILHSASKLPMLRKISLDVCDAREGDLDIPSFSDRCFLSIVKIARCKLQKCVLDVHGLGAQRRPIHKETLALVWSSERLVQTVVKERL